MVANLPKSIDAAEDLGAATQYVFDELEEVNLDGGGEGQES